MSEVVVSLLDYCTHYFIGEILHYKQLAVTMGGGKRKELTKWLEK